MNPRGEPLLDHPRYELGETLGQGAQGLVARVRDREDPTAPLVAKLFRGGVFDERALLGEFGLLARLRIEGLVRAHDLARDRRTGAPFIVEAFVDGMDAAAWVQDVPTDRRSERLATVIACVARTLAALHEAGFVHGDLKPVHVRMSEPRGAGRGKTSATATVLDLGAAVSRARLALDASAYTPAFASPERLAGEPASPASDLYALGALAYFAATGSAPARGSARVPLRRRAPFVRPSLAELIEALCAEHPRDRPLDASAVLQRLGAAGRGQLWLGDLPQPIGRERDLAALLGGASPVTYLTGPSGIGKSHVARELVTRSLLAGKPARLLSFPESAPSVPRLVSFFRGAEDALPFVEDALDDDAMLLVLDHLDAAPRELVDALDAYRCRIGAAARRRVRVVAALRSPPRGVDSIALGPLDETSFAELCAALGERDASAAAVASGRNPGFFVASLGRVPLTASTALERAKSLSEPASALLSAVALAGGALARRCCRSLLGLEGEAEATPAPVAELLEAGLLGRRGAASELYVLTAPAIAKPVASALASFDLVDRVADVLLADSSTAASALLAVASAEQPPRRRAELLARAAQRARSDGLRSEEIEALLALAADSKERSGDLLRRLERLSRDTGTEVHPAVLDWLDEAARLDPALVPLSKRRRAEQRARAGDAAAAEEAATEALTAARDLGDIATIAFALATSGLVALFRADWEAAAARFAEARGLLARVDVADPEEVARLDHNLGVVALYRERIDEAIAAFERSLATKRKLGDRAGVRSCLLNLGLALARAARLDDAERALAEAIELARSLGQTAGLGWCLAARADIEVRRGRPRDAIRWIGEADSLASALPPAVRADLVLLAADCRILEGDGAGALAVLATVDARMRSDEAAIRGRALVVEAAAHLATLPALPRKAARLAIAALRVARAARQAEVESHALAVLQRARRQRGASTNRRYPPGVQKAEASRSASAPSPSDSALWAWIARTASGLERDEALFDLARTVVECARAERAFVAEVDGEGSVRAAWGVDVDGFRLSEAERRVPRDLIAAALDRTHGEPLYARDVATVGGRGSRLAAAAPASELGLSRAVVVVEHRFDVAHFDSVAASEAERWAALAALALRIVHGVNDSETRSAAALESRPPAARPNDPTTAFPQLEPRRSFPAILGESPALRRALGRLDQAIDSELPVLIWGETGVGKELFARALHEMGPRRGRSLVAINCGAVPESLFEAELFGHVRGSFTGAERARPGLIARAEGGTLLLDEIGELPLSRQATLLRALESRTYRPVGSDEERPFDVRVVAATNRDLETAVSERSFRQDLLFRINAVTIRIPALRDRTGDVALLAETFLERAGARTALSPAALEALAAYGWPGNVRELEHQMQRLASLGATQIGLEHLPRAIRVAPRRTSTVVALPADRSPASGRGQPSPDAQRDEITRALEATTGNISHAAERLGLTRHGLKKRMLRLGMRARGGESKE